MDALKKVRHCWASSAIDAAPILVQQPLTLDARAERVEFEVKMAGDTFAVTHVTAEDGVPLEWLSLNEIQDVEELCRFFADRARQQILDRSAAFRSMRNVRADTAKHTLGESVAAGRVRMHFAECGLEFEPNDIK